MRHNIKNQLLGSLLWCAFITIFPCGTILLFYQFYEAIVNGLAFEQTYKGVITILGVMFILHVAFYIAVVLLYNVQPKVWDTIHEKRDTSDFYKLIPDLKVIIDFIEYFGDTKDVGE